MPQGCTGGNPFLLKKVGTLPMPADAGGGWGSGRFQP